ncbi:MAG: peptidylprolyl isomerase [Bryobacteraceae bacterium]
MHFPLFYLLLAQATPPASPLPPPRDTVIATSGTTKVTMGDLVDFIAGAPPDKAENYKKDPKRFIEEMMLMRKLADQAVEQSLDKMAPHKHVLAYQRLGVLTNARMQHAQNSIAISDEEVLAYHKKNPHKFQRARTKVIYLPYSATPPPPPAGAAKVLTEAQAKALAGSIVKQARSGVDFVKLVKAHSQHAETASRHGDYEPIRRDNKQIPPVIVNAVFALKPGGVTEPIRLQNGYYVFRLEEMITPGLNEVREEVSQLFREERFNAWFKQMQASVKVTIENEAVLKKMGGK